MSLRQIVRTIAGAAFGTDREGNIVANRRDGSQIVLEADATTGVPSITTRTAAGLEGSYPVSGGAVAAPATLDASNAATYNGATLNLAAAATLTVSDAAWALLPAGIAINVGQSGSATLAFSGTATKENASGTSATSVTLAASGVYALLPSPSGSPKFRLSGGASV